MKKRYSVFVMAAMLLAMLFTAFCAGAGQSARVINYQGKLTQSDGTPVADGTYSAMFEIFDTPNPAQGQDPLWHSAKNLQITVLQGVFSVELGAGNPFPDGLFEENDDLYLRITLEGEQMQPLQHLTAVPYALRATEADYAISAQNVDNGTISGDLFVDGKLGIGTNSPESLLHLSSLGGIDLVIEADTNNIGEDQNARVVLRQDGGQVTARMGYRNGENALEIMQEFNDKLIFGTNSLDRMTITSDGKIGIGTGNPDSKLHVAMPSGIFGTPPVASTVKGLVIKDGYINTANRLEVQDEHGTPDFVVSSTGKIGIGTSNPDAPLVIDGGGEGFPAGFLYIRNVDKDAGIRIYNGNEVKHHIYNDKDLGFANDVLRIAPQGSFASGGITITQGGNVGINTTLPTKDLTVRGNLLLVSKSTGVEIVELGEGLDYAEGFNVSDREKLDAGTVLIIDPESPGHLKKSFRPYDRKVAGIVAGAKGLGSGVRLASGRFDHNVALAGRVYCKVDATKEGIEPGDLLTTSETPGYAMKVSDYPRAQGAVLGKAMERLEKGKRGLILVLVTLQ